MKRETILEALDCCMKVFGCEKCPLLGDICDDPKVEYMEIPVPLMEEIKREIRGESGSRIQ